MWLRNDPPKAPWKKLSQSVLRVASAASGRFAVWYLRLLLIEAMNEVWTVHPNRDVLLDIKWRVG
jgi:hypothetical protein